MTRGERAEQKVQSRLREALPTPGYRVFANVSWTGPVRDHGPARDGEADLVIAHAEHGLLVIEVKSGRPSRDGAGRWYLGTLELTKSPFKQAEASKHFLRDKLVDLPDRPADLDPVVGHAVAFPDVDLDSLPPGHALLGVDAPTDLVLDAEALETPDGVRSWVEGAFRFWSGDGAGRRPLGASGLALLEELLQPTLTLRRLIRGRIEDDREELVALGREQSRLLDQWRSIRRVEILGPAGSGKSMLAAAKARRLAGEGFRTLLVCFNQRLATTMQRDLADAKAPAGLRVTTFHRLCEILAAEAGTLPARPSPIPQAWWDETLPGALDAAIGADPETRFHAIIVDEGQDFARGWLESLQLMLMDRDDDVIWIFHDPAQALFRPDVVGELGLARMELWEDHRNPPAVAQLAMRFRDGTDPIVSLRPDVRLADGLTPAEVIEAEPGAATLEALRKTLHRLLVDEQVSSFRVAVLSGQTASKSGAWKRRRFGNAVLWNEALADDGMSRGLPPEQVPDEPPDVVLFETIRRFKGLEREVVVLVELPEDGERLDELLYVGLTRATTHLVVIAPPSLAQRLRAG